MTYHAKLMAGGKVVIPAELRRELELAIGDHLVFERENGKIVLKTYAQVVREVQDSLKRFIRPGVSLVDELIAERIAENERDEEEARERAALRR